MTLATYCADPHCAPSQLCASCRLAAGDLACDACGGVAIQLYPDGTPDGLPLCAVCHERDRAEEAAHPELYPGCTRETAAITCEHCRNEAHARDILSGRRRTGDAGDHYASCSARVYFAGRALDALRAAGAGRTLLRLAEEFRLDVGNTGD